MMSVVGSFNAASSWWSVVLLVPATVQAVVIVGALVEGREPPLIVRIP